MWISQLMSRLTLSLKRKPKRNTAVIESLGRGKQAGQRTERGVGGATYRREDEAACGILTFKWRQRKSRHQLLNCRVDISPPPPPEWSQGVHPPFTRHFSRFLRHLLTRLFLFSSPFFVQRQMAFLLYLWNIISPSTLAFLFLPHKRPCFWAARREKPQWQRRGGWCPRKLRRSRIDHLRAQWAGGHTKH